MNKPQPEVTGGSVTVDAALQDMRAHARRLDRSGDETRRLARGVATLARHLPAKSALLSPDTAAPVAGRLGALVLGPGGLPALAVRLELLARGMRLSADAYARVEETHRTAFELIQIPVGVAIVTGAITRGATEAATVSIATAPIWWTRPQLWPRAAEETARRFVLGLAESIYLEPELVDASVSSMRAIVPGFVFEQEVAWIVLNAERFGLLRDDRPLEVQQTIARTDHPAGDLGGLLTTQQDILSTPSETDAGTRIRAQRVLGEDGTHRWVVSIPGTQDWDPTTPVNPSDVTSNLRSIAGLPSTLHAAIAAALAQAMRQAGVRPGKEPVMLAGHSQGGLVATRLAATSSFRRRFNVTSVMTAGAPSTRVDVPRSVSVLSIEHRRDPVPRLDSRARADRSNRVRVVMDATPTPGRTPSTATAHHALTYARSARTQLSPDGPLDPRLRRWYAEHDAFLNGRQATTYDTLIRRPP